jgi:hypothetical protein
LFTIGVASSPKGQPLFLLLSLGVPTRSIITEVVNQKDAVNHPLAAIQGDKESPKNGIEPEKSKVINIPRENQVITRPAKLYNI